MEEKNARPVKGADKAEVMQVIHTQTTHGSGEEGDFRKTVDQYWTLDGKLLASEISRSVGIVRGSSE